MNTKKQTPPGYLKGAKAIGAFLGLPTRRCFTLIKSGSLPVLKEEGEYLVSVTALNAFLAGNFLPDALVRKTKVVPSIDLVEQRAREFKALAKLPEPKATKTILADVIRRTADKTCFPREFFPTGSCRPAAAPMPFLLSRAQLLERGPEAP